MYSNRVVLTKRINDKKKDNFNISSSVNVFYAILLIYIGFNVSFQAICDHKCQFIHCYVGNVGSVHDQRVFRLSEIQSYLGDVSKFPEDCHLVGDLAYKLHENFLTPYRDNGHMTERQRNYNFLHSSARITIERAFGLLKVRFRSLLTTLAMVE